MKKIATLGILCLSLVLAPSLAGAQVEARQATPEETAKMEKGPAASSDVEVPNPMLLEIPLTARPGRRAVWDLEKGQSWVATETRRFVCDRARVPTVLVRRTEHRKGVMKLRIEPSITSEWYRQDIDLTIVLEGGDGTVLGKKFWDDLTLGNSGGPYSGHTRSPELEVSLTAEQWAAHFGAGKSPRVKILIEIQGEEGDSDDG